MNLVYNFLMESSDAANRRRTVEFARPDLLADIEQQIASGTEPPPLTDPSLYISRELSSLAFQWRVLEEAQDESNPLLERFKFLSILGSNLDEFFMVRVAGLKRRIESGSISAGPDGLTPSQQLHAISSEVTRLLSEAQSLLSNSLLPTLEKSGISIVTLDQLNSEEQDQLREYFLNRIFPVLTPLAFDPGHPFPLISNLSHNLAILIRDANGEERFARVKIPDSLQHLIPIKHYDVPSRSEPQEQRQSYIWIDVLVKAHLSYLFPGMTILETSAFQIIRDAELEIQEWEDSDLLETTAEGLHQRRFGDVVRLQVDSEMPARTLEILMTNLEIEPYDVYLVEGRIGLSSLKHIAAIDRNDLKFLPFVPTVKAALAPEAYEDDIFAAISRKDIMLHHPFDSFQPVIHFLNQAALDPNVLAIKMTLYRVGRNSPVVEALLRANRNGKQVAVMVELKARFDEESNIEWAKALESEGVHVVYGLKGLKCHSKLALVVRQEGDSIKRYVHLGTGNYNPVTAHMYTDLGLFTCNEKIGSDVSDLFNYLTGYSDKKDYRRLLVAPINLRDRFEDLIQREIQHHKNGEHGRIILKMNALVDDRMIRLLYEASQAGVSIDLIVRGMCCLRPGVVGVSDNIRVTSIVGRFLEHSRIYYFRNGGKEELFCGSADLMSRNLDVRVEVLFPVKDKRFASVLKAILGIYLADNVKARQMQSDASYTRKVPGSAPSINSQEWLLTSSQGSSQIHAGTAVDASPPISIE